MDILNFTLEMANRLIEASFLEAKKLTLKPLSIAVLDPGGHLIAFQRQDHAAILRFEIAYAKAYGALGMGIGSRGLAKMAKEIPDLINGAMLASHGRFIAAPGGVLVVNQSGQIIAAVGASGDTSDNDERAVISGITGIGLMPKVD
jgi:uncharacterized protein GlcG (DUF336 family)